MFDIWRCGGRGPSCHGDYELHVQTGKGAPRRRKQKKGEEETANAFREEQLEKQGQRTLARVRLTGEFLMDAKGGANMAG